jgi:hypothetical protein
MWLTALAFVALQLLAVCHLGELGFRAGVLGDLQR